MVDCSIKCRSWGSSIKHRWRWCLERGNFQDCFSFRVLFETIHSGSRSGKRSRFWMRPRTSPRRILPRWGYSTCDPDCTRITASFPPDAHALTILVARQSKTKLRPNHLDGDSPSLISACPSLSCRPPPRRAWKTTMCVLTAVCVCVRVCLKIRRGDLMKTAAVLH